MSVIWESKNPRPVGIGSHFVLMVIGAIALGLLIAMSVVWGR